MHEKSIKFWGVTVGILGAVSVGLGAFATHTLRDLVEPSRLATFQTGVSYMQFHVAGIAAIVLLMLYAGPVPWLRRAAAFQAVGIVLFTGSLTTLTVTGATWLGAVAPIGGVAFIAGWLSVAVFFSQSHLLRKEV